MERQKRVIKEREIEQKMSEKRKEEGRSCGSNERRFNDFWLCLCV
jgi:hypothetical protein